MDMFMDKLAQKLTAQEIIRANTAADIEELNKLKNQIAEYNECLARLQKLIDDGEAKLAAAQTQDHELVRAGVEEIKRHLAETRSLVQQGFREVQAHSDEGADRVQKNINNLQNVQADILSRQIHEGNDALRASMDGLCGQVREGNDGLRASIEGLSGQMREGNDNLCASVDKLSSAVGSRSYEIQKRSDEMIRLLQENSEKIQTLRQDVDSLYQIQGKLVEKLDSVDKSMIWHLEYMAKSMEDKLNQLETQEEEEASSQLGERMDAVEEAVHRECVKVYRNVQAVVTEESGKQDNALTEMKSSVAGLKGKLGAVLTFSVLAMILSLAGVAVQVLGRLGILPF